MAHAVPRPPRAQNRVVVRKREPIPLGDRPAFRLTKTLGHSISNPLSPRTVTSDEVKKNHMSEMMTVIDTLNERWGDVQRAVMAVHRYDCDAASLVARHRELALMGPQSSLSRSTSSTRNGRPAPNAVKVHAPAPPTNQAASSRRPSTAGPRLDAATLAATAAPLPSNALDATRVPMEPLCVHIMHAIGLSPKDEPALGAVIASCLVPPQKDIQIVDVPKLKKLCQTQRPAPEWRTRFQAHGVMDKRVQQATTGVVKNSNAYRKRYTGVPYGVTGDPDCTNAMQKQFFAKRMDRIRVALLRYSVFGVRSSVRQPPCKIQPADPKNPPPTAKNWIDVPTFRSVLMEVDRKGTGMEEAKHVIGIMDPRSSGFIDVDGFMKRFGWDLMKQRSTRNAISHENNDGRTNTFEWRDAFPTTTVSVNATSIAGSKGEPLNPETTPGCSEYNTKAVLKAMINRDRRMLEINVKRNHSLRLRTQCGKFTRQYNETRERLAEEQLERMPPHEDKQHWSMHSRNWNQSLHSDRAQHEHAMVSTLQDGYQPLEERLAASQRRHRAIRDRGARYRLTSSSGAEVGNVYTTAPAAASQRSVSPRAQPREEAYTVRSPRVLRPSSARVRPTFCN